MEDPRQEEGKGYQCQRCGEVTEGPNATLRYCAFCGVHEVELLQVANPTQRSHGSHRLPAAV